MRALGMEIEEELDDPRRHIDDLPFDLRYLWELWCEVGAARNVNGMAPCPISFADLHAWSHFTGVTLTPWDVSALQAIDTTWMINHVESNKKKTR